MFRRLAALAAGWGLIMGTALAGEAPAAADVKTEAAPPPAPPELRVLEEERAKLAEEETAIVADLRARQAPSTNLVEAAGGDLELAAKMKRVQELQEELRVLQKEVVTRLAKDPKLAERRLEMEKPRARLMEIHQRKRELDLKIKALKDGKGASKGTSG